ncbi:FixH family protein [Halobacillus litoralis]|uniref:FixH family protein n=1 Tax=Halobacillus litoralis TaxID=45668 RepID=UPI001CFC7DF6|nr:FixH family protein [Halobacillus litoralis]
MKKFIFLACALICLFITACSSEEKTPSSEDENTAEIPEVEVTFEQTPLPVNKETTIKAKVTQGGEPVTEASYVKFEIWKNSKGQDSSETIEAQHEASGIYKIKQTFNEEGTYQIIAHTQVDDLHVMPQKEVTVGKQTQSSVEHHEDTNGRFMVNLMTDQVFKAGEESTLITHINHMEDPFTEAEVRFEISSDNLDKHIFIDAEENELGEYESTYTFPQAGQYTINIHYEKPAEEIHGHQEQTVEVTK